MVRYVSRKGSQLGDPTNRLIRTRFSRWAMDCQIPGHARGPCKRQLQAERAHSSPFKMALLVSSLPSSLAVIFLLCPIS